MQQVKEIIKSRRIALGYTMLDVAKRVGVSEGTVSRWESGDIANMRRDKIAALAETLQISPAVIMGWDSNLYEKQTSSAEINHAATLTELQREMLDLFDRLSEDEQIKLIGRLEYMVESAEQNAAPKKHGAIYQHAAIAAKGGTLNKGAKKKVKTTLK